MTFPPIAAIPTLQKVTDAGNSTTTNLVSFLGTLVNIGSPSASNMVLQSTGGSWDFSHAWIEFQDHGGFMSAIGGDVIYMTDYHAGRYLRWSSELGFVVGENSVGDEFVVLPGGGCKITSMTTPPTSPPAGTIYFNTSDGHFYGTPDGTTWNQLDN